MLFPGAETMDLAKPLAEYAERGFAPLGRVLSDEAMVRLRERTDDLMLGRVAYPGLFYQRDTETGRYDDLEFGKGWQGPSLNYRKLEKLEKDPLFLTWIQNPLFARIAHAVVGTQVSIYRAVVFNKASQGGTVLPWHQDGGTYWGLDRAPVLQIWTALDDVPPSAGCVEFLPHSHKSGLATPLGGLVPSMVANACGADDLAVRMPARAGEAILIHNLVWHRSGVNTTAAARRALTICYMSSETRCLRRKRPPRNFTRVF